MKLFPIAIDSLLSISVITIGFSMITNGITVANLIYKEITKIGEQVDIITKKKVLLPPDLKKVSKLEPHKDMKRNLRLFKVAVIVFFILLIMVSYDPRLREYFYIDLVQHCIYSATKKPIPVTEHEFTYFVVLVIVSWIEMGLLLCSLFSSVKLTSQYLKILKINRKNSK